MTQNLIIIYRKQVKSLSHYRYKASKTNVDEFNSRTGHQIMDVLFYVGFAAIMIVWGVIKNLDEED